MLRYFCLFILPILCLTQCNGEQTDLWEKKSKYVRVKRNMHDKTVTEFVRDPENRKLVKTVRSMNGRIIMTTTYVRNPKGFLTAGRILDGNGKPLFRVRYGYHKETGLLVAEEMYDERKKRFFPNTNTEMPARKLYYTYDANGNQSKAISLVSTDGEYAEEVFDQRNSTRPDLNPFDLEEKQKKQAQ